MMTERTGRDRKWLLGAADRIKIQFNSNQISIKATSRSMTRKWHNNDASMQMSHRICKWAVHNLSIRRHVTANQFNLIEFSNLNQFGPRPARGPNDGPPGQLPAGRITGKGWKRPERGPLWKDFSDLNQAPPAARKGAKRWPSGALQPGRITGKGLIAARTRATFKRFKALDAVRVI